MGLHLGGGASEGEESRCTHQGAGQEPHPDAGVGQWPLAQAFGRESRMDPGWSGGEYEAFWAKVLLLCGSSSNA